MDREVYFFMSKDEKLNGHNYPLWAFKIKQSFMKEKVLFVIKDDHPTEVNNHVLVELGKAPTDYDTQYAKAKAISWVAIPYLKI